MKPTTQYYTLLYDEAKKFPWRLFPDALPASYFHVENVNYVNFKVTYTVIFVPLRLNSSRITVKYKSQCLFQLTFLHYLETFWLDENIPFSGYLSRNENFKGNFKFLF